MKFLITLAFIAAAGCAALSYTRLLPATSMMPPILFAVAFILTLLHLINSNDRRY